MVVLTQLIRVVVALSAVASCHVVITYPGWRGNNLISNGSFAETDGLGVGISSNGQLEYPYGMQWIYPCGGLTVSSNRTAWPVNGGAVAFQPGWFQGHQHGILYVNIGFGEVPDNYSVPVAAPLQMTGPTNYPFPGTICLPQLPIPAGHTVKVGDFATIQIVEAAVHGAALYSCVDIVFADPADVAPLNETNCFNSTDITLSAFGANSCSTTITSAASQSTGSSSISSGNSVASNSASPTSSTSPAASTTGVTSRATNAAAPSSHFASLTAVLLLLMSWIAYCSQ